MPSPDMSTFVIFLLLTIITNILCIAMDTRASEYRRSTVLYDVEIPDRSLKRGSNFAVFLLLVSKISFSNNIRTLSCNERVGGLPICLILLVSTAVASSSIGLSLSPPFLNGHYILSHTLPIPVHS